MNAIQIPFWSFLYLAPFASSPKLFQSGSSKLFSFNRRNTARHNGTRSSYSESQFCHKHWCVQPHTDYFYISNSMLKKEDTFYLVVLLLSSDHQELTDSLKNFFRWNFTLTNSVVWITLPSRGVYITITSSLVTSSYTREMYS